MPSTSAPSAARRSTISGPTPEASPIVIAIGAADLMSAVCPTTSSASARSSPNPPARVSRSTAGPEATRPTPCPVATDPSHVDGVPGRAPPPRCRRRSRRSRRAPAAFAATSGTARERGGLGVGPAGVDGTAPASAGRGRSRSPLPPRRPRLDPSSENVGLPCRGACDLLGRAGWRCRTRRAPAR